MPGARAICKALSTWKYRAPKMEWCKKRMGHSESSHSTWEDKNSAWDANRPQWGTKCLEVILNALLMFVKCWLWASQWNRSLSEERGRRQSMGAGKSFSNEMGFSWAFKYKVSAGGENWKNISWPLLCGGVCAFMCVVTWSKCFHIDNDPNCQHLEESHDYVRNTRHGDRSYSWWGYCQVKKKTCELERQSCSLR